MSKEKDDKRYDLREREREREGERERQPSFRPTIVVVVSDHLGHADDRFSSAYFSLVFCDNG